MKSVTELVSTSPVYNASNVSERELVVCHLESPLAEVMDKAVTKHVQRVWVVDGQGFLVGIVSLTDTIRVIKATLISDSHVV